MNQEDSVKTFRLKDPDELLETGTTRVRHRVATITWKLLWSSRRFHFVSPVSDQDQDGEGVIHETLFCRINRCRATGIDVELLPF